MGSSFARWMLALRSPPALGVKVTVKVVLAPGARLLLPGADTVKSPGFTPSLVMAPRVKVSAPLLVTVKVFAALGVPTI